MSHTDPSSLLVASYLVLDSTLSLPITTTLSNAPLDDLHLFQSTNACSQYPRKYLVSYECLSPRVLQIDTHCIVGISYVISLPKF